MNIFATEQGILGDTGYARQHNTFQAFLTLARSIRKRLGAQAYKLDEYIRQLLIACSIPVSYTHLVACAPPFKMFIIGTGSCLALTPPM